MSTLKFAGNGTSKAFLPDVKGMIVLIPGTTITVALAKTLAGWQAKINPATSAAIVGTYIDLARGFEEKTTAPEFTTANTGLKEKTKDFEPEFTGYAMMSWEDYRTWFGADAKEYAFVMVLADGSLLAPLDSTGLLVGFGGKMFVSYGLPKAGGDGKQKACPFDVMFDDIEQIKNYQIIKTTFGRKELEASVPVGINIEVITAYESSGGTVVLKATHRVSGLPYAGFTAYTQWVVVSTSLDSGGAATAISATSAAIGVYTVTFLNGTPKMTGDFEIQAETIAAEHVTYLSNVLNVNV
ncbi:MAG: hypothetical protein IMZ64_11825 [Bacteroidetes bacterium]|nr:hypothetical protein [Bacteroidota bacterium]